jgi:hypothetical protein
MINCDCPLGKAAHPMTFHALRKELVMHAFVAGSLFARKFDQGIKINDFHALWEAMDSEPTQVLRVAETVTYRYGFPRLWEAMDSELTQVLRVSGDGYISLRRYKS